MPTSGISQTNVVYPHSRVVDRVKALLDRIGMSPEIFGEAAGLSPSTLRRSLANPDWRPRPDTLSALETALQICERAMAQHASLLMPLTGDGEHVAKVQEEIRAWLALSGDDRCKDKFSEWKTRLKEARYLDWKAAQAS